MSRYEEGFISILQRVKSGTTTDDDALLLAMQMIGSLMAQAEYEQATALGQWFADQGYEISRIAALVHEFSDGKLQVVSSDDLLNIVTPSGDRH